VCSEHLSVGAATEWRLTREKLVGDDSQAVQIRALVDWTFRREIGRRPEWEYLKGACSVPVDSSMSTPGLIPKVRDLRNSVRPNQHV